MLLPVRRGSSCSNQPRLESQLALFGACSRPVCTPSCTSELCRRTCLPHHVLHQPLSTRGQPQDHFQPSSKYSIHHRSSMAVRASSTALHTVREETQAAGGRLSQERLAELEARFKQADTDGNGLIEGAELRRLLESTGGGLEDSGLQWLTESMVATVLASYDINSDRGISFREFVLLVEDGILLDGTLDDYKAAFNAVDTSGNGTIGATEIQALFKELGQPLSSAKLFALMEQYDVDQSGQIEFDEFLVLFWNEMLDLRDMMQYMKLAPSLPPAGEPRLIEWVPGEMALIFSEAELDAIMAQHPDRLVVLMASFTWCRPCKGFERPYQRFAEAYDKAIFLKFYGNSNESTKHLFKDRLNTPMTPFFTYWRGGKMLHSHTGNSREKVEAAMQGLLTEAENPLTGANPFKRQVWHTKMTSGASMDRSADAADELQDTISTSAR